MIKTFPSTRAPLRSGLLFAVLSIVSVSFFSTGCGLFDPPTGGSRDTTGTFVYPPLDTPENTLINLQLAWRRSDSTRVKLLYATDYQGQSSTPETTYTFTWSDEVDVVTRIGARHQVTNVIFDLKAPSTWIRNVYPTDPQGWVAFQVPSMNIVVDDTEHGTQQANSSSQFEFKLKPFVAAPADTDTTWQIIRWAEFDTGT